MTRTRKIIIVSPARLLGWLRPFRSLGRASRRMALALFLWGIGEGLWLYVRPLYVTELGGNPVQVGQVLAVAGLAPVLLMLPAGRLIDRTGPRFLLMLTWWIGTAAAVLLAIAPGWQWLIPGFFLYAMSASSIPAINAYIAHDAQQEQEISAQQVQSVIAVVYAAYFAGTIPSPLVGGWLAQVLGLRLVFWVSAGWFLLSSLVILSLPNTPWRFSADLSADGPTRPWWRFSKAQLRIFGTLFLFFFTIGMGYALVPNFLEDVRQMPLGVIGGLGTATAIGGVAWMLVLGRRHSREALAIGAILFAVAFLVLLLAPLSTWQIPPMLLVYFLLGVYLTVRTLSLGVVSEHTPLDQQGTGFAMVETMFGAGVFLGPLAAGLLYDRSPHLPFALALAALLPLAALLWLNLRPAEWRET